MHCSRVEVHLALGCETAEALSLIKSYIQIFALVVAFRRVLSQGRYEYSQVSFGLPNFLASLVRLEIGEVKRARGVPTFEFNFHVVGDAASIEDLNLKRCALMELSEIVLASLNDLVQIVEKRLHLLVC